MKKAAKQPVIKTTTKKRTPHRPPRSWPKSPTKAKPRTMAEAFDEWDRLYIEEPEKFEQQWRSIMTFIAEGGREGKATSQGQLSAAWLVFLMSGEPTRDW